MTAVNQKEYLKKYLSIGSEPGKKKKRKKKGVLDRVKIIDDDIDVAIFNKAVEDDLYAMNEDAPQIVGVIDERPLELRIDDYRKSDKWKPVGTQSAEGNNLTQYDQTDTLKHLKNAENDYIHQVAVKSEDNSPPRKYNKDNVNQIEHVEKGNDSSPIRKNKDEDISPPRHRKYDVSPSPPRKRKFDSNPSPPRNRRHDLSPPGRSRRDSDASPPRRKRGRSETDLVQKNGKRDNSMTGEYRRSHTREEFKYNKENKKYSSSSSSRKFNSDKDFSPPRKYSRNSDESASRNHRRSDFNRSESTSKYIETVAIKSDPDRDNDSSPPRKRRSEDNLIRWDKRNSDTSSVGKSKTHDISPPRRSRRKSDDSPQGKNCSPEKGNQKQKDSSPPRRSRRKSDDSPQGKNCSPEKGNQKQKDSSPTRKGAGDVLRRYKSRWDSGPSGEDSKEKSDSSSAYADNLTKQDTSQTENGNKMKKTLDGKTAGLQKANELIMETQAFKKREDELFKNMSAEVSGKNATAVRRDRKTGKIRDLEGEAEKESKKRKEEEENKEKYAKWGKGLKQVEEFNEKISNELYEMSKPLARYADDEDLERHLKEKEREGDPMLAYIRAKRKKTEIVMGKPLKPEYEGEFMPNRYGIRPGHRWDGVDRSNGYEKKWFEVLNSRRANQEEVYKWSTEDM